MAPKEKDRSNIPINFFDADSEDGADAEADQVTDGLSDDYADLANVMDYEDNTTAGDDDVVELVDEPQHAPTPAKGSTGDLALNMGGPEVAELVATRAELKRLEGEVKELL